MVSCGGGGGAGAEATSVPSLVRDASINSIDGDGFSGPIVAATSSDEEAAATLANLHDPAAVMDALRVAAYM